MSIGLALLIIAALYLIEKHHLWRRAFQITGALLVLAVLGIAGLTLKENRDAAEFRKRQTESAQTTKPILDMSKATPIPHGSIDDMLTEVQKEEFAIARTKHTSNRRVEATSDTDLHTTEFGLLVCGHIAAGDTTTLLVDDGVYAKIKTGTGQIGWVPAEAFKVIR